MPTDFSFVSDEGWDALKPRFERAEQKLDEKVRRKDMTEDQAKKIKDLMWKKYEHWAEGKGMKEKENQTALQDKKTKKASAMQREARLGKLVFEDIIGYIVDGTIPNSSVFQDTLKVNHASEQEFFDMFAREVKDKPSLYPRQFLVSWNDHFDQWGYGEEMKAVMQAAQRPLPAAPMTSAPRGLPGAAPAAPAQTAPQAPAPAPAPAQAPAAPAPEGKMTVDDLAPQQEQFKVEPKPWPQGMQPPKGTTGRGARWYAQYVLPDGTPSAGIAEGLTRDEMLKFIYKLQSLGVKWIGYPKPITSFGPDAPPAAAAPATPAPAQTTPPAAKPYDPNIKPGRYQSKQDQLSVGEIDAPDPVDPNSYRWYLKWQNKNGNVVAMSPDFTGAQMKAQMREIERMGLRIVELKKMHISPKASLAIADSDIRLAADGEPQEKFRNGTPIIFTEDVNLEFDALSARGQIKKNMTGKIKKVEDNDYLIDIAGQLYRVPRLVAEHVMDVFAANVVPHEDQMEAPAPQPGQKPVAQPAPQPAKAPAPAAQSAAPAAGQNQGQNESTWSLPPAPKAKPGMAGVLGRIVVGGMDRWEDAPEDEHLDAPHGWQGVFIENVEESIPGFFEMSDQEMDVALGEYAYMLSESETTPQPSWGSSDTLIRLDDDVVISYNSGLGYASINQKAGDPDAGKGELVRSPDGSPKIGSIDDRIVVADFELEAMAMSNGMLAKAFVNGATKGKGSHMFIEDDTIYSYGRHFPVATRNGDAFLLTDQRYSVSTARHISEVRNAIIRAGGTYVLSDRFENGKVAAPTPEEIAARSQKEAEAKAKRDKLDEKRKLRDQKKLTTQRNQVPEERVQDIAETENKNLDDKAYIEQHDERGRPLKWRIDRTLAPSTLEETPSLTPQQWMSRIQDIEDQLLRETDPARQEKLRQRMERMKQASWAQSMLRVADDNPKGGKKADFDDLQSVIRDQDKNVIREKNQLKEQPLPHQKKAAVESKGFADLLMLIEQGGPGIPSEIGKRLYRADGAVSRAS